MVKKILIRSFGSLLALLAMFYLFCVVPNDVRAKREIIRPAGNDFLDLSYDFIANLRSARIKTREIHGSWEALSRYPYKQMSKYLHTAPVNMHLSLGWFPMKTVHEDCIFAPADTNISFRVRMPEKPVLKFDYGIISSVEGKKNSAVRFSVVVKDESKAQREVFRATEAPLEPYRWRYYDGYYKNFYKYLKPSIEEREGKWESAEVDLSEFSGKNVEILFLTDAFNSAVPGLAFWGTPRLYEKTETRDSKNVILIIVDSFRADEADVLSAPNVSALAAEGVEFTEALANGNATKLSVYSFFTSMYPFEIPETAAKYEMSPIDKENYYRRRLPTIASTLKKNGYRTAAIGSVSLLSDGYGLSADMGFDETVNLEHSGYSPVHVTQEAMKWLAKHGGEKFFLMLYYEGPHGPYRPPLRYFLKSFFRTGGSLRRKLYRGEIMYHDAYVGRFLDFLRKRGLLENSVVIFTADHGVAFRKTEYDWPTRFGSWKKKSVRFHSHGVSVTPEDLRVPLIFYNAGYVKRITERVQLLDLFPSILDIIGVKQPRLLKGRSLTGLMQGEGFRPRATFHQGWHNFGVYDGKYLYVRNTSPREGFPPETVVPEELFDVENDPDCSDNLVHECDYALLARLRGKMGAVGPEGKRIKLYFSGDEGSQLTMRLYSTTGIEAVNADKKTARTYGKLLTAKLNPGESFSFSLNRNRSGFSVKCFIDGELMPAEDLLCGRYALPLLGSTYVPGSLWPYLEGFPGKFYEKNKVYIGIVPEEAPGPEDLKDSPEQLKSMLEEWGYIN
ncbi:MAG: sulfatase [Endomicrobiales bacterium]|nr:sulfatase [Endomicrobiales bacterium]